jgi:DnaA family protein
MSAQLALNLRLRDRSSFDNYCPGSNREALNGLRRIAEGVPGILYLWGEPATGRTHLLEAACRRAQERGGAPAYLPLREVSPLGPGVLEGLERAVLVCLDDLDAVAGRSEWERALFGFWEARRAAGGAIVVAASVSPTRLGVGLPDLVTRLASATVYQLKPLDDEQKLSALRERARARGFELGEEAARYLLARYPRDLHSLFVLLDRIDAAALERQRRVTIPFLRSLEERQESPDKMKRS